MFSFLTVRRKPGWLAIVPHGDGVTLAHVVRRRDVKPELRLLETFAIEHGAADALQRLRARYQLKTYACTSLLPTGEYNVTQLEAPAVPKEERREALRWALKESVSYPVDSACIDVLDLPGDRVASGRANNVLLVSAPEPAVRAHVAPFEDAGISLAALDIAELAQRNVSALLEDENRGLVFLRIDAQNIMLTLSYRGELISVRREERGARVPVGAEDEAVARANERMALELQRSLDNFDRQYSHITVSRIVLALDPPVEGLAAVLAASTYLPVQEMDLSDVLDFTAVPEMKNPRLQARHLLAIGAALRDEVPA